MEELLCVETREINAIDGILSMLLKEDLLTDIECRIIVSIQELAEKQGAIYRVIMSKTKEKAANLTEIFRTLTAKFYSAENSNIQIPDSEDLKANVLLNANNPFLHNTVIRNLFEYLPLEDIKNFRTVCRQWNSTAEILLRRRSRIVFIPGILMPPTFLKFSEYSLPDLPFSTFEFEKGDDNNVWEISDVQNFFNHWGKKIKDIRFDRLILTSDAYSDKIPNFYDVSPWFATAYNLTTLVLDCSIKCRPLFNISWETLASLPMLNVLYLIRCGIIIKHDTKFNRISCEQIELHNIGFKQGGKFIPCRYNDVFDFRRSRHIELQNLKTSQSKCILDMQNEVFNADTVTFQNITIQNWGKARGTIEALILKGSPIVEKNNLKIKKIRSESSLIDLSAFSQSIEMLFLISYGDIICSEPLYLPNLKSLTFEVRDNNLPLLTQFRNCESLKQLVLYNIPASEEPLLFNARYIPSSVQLLRLGCNLLEFLDEYIWEFSNGTLVLDYFRNRIVRITDLEKITSQILAETLVVICYKHMKVDSADLMKLIFANKQAKTIIIGSEFKNYNMHKKIPFEGSLISKHVDKKSNYYEFKNQVGKAIPRSQFKKWLKQDVW